MYQLYREGTTGTWGLLSAPDTRQNPKITQQKGLPSAILGKHDTTTKVMAKSYPPTAISWAFDKGFADC